MKYYVFLHEPYFINKSESNQPVYMLDIKMAKQLLLRSEVLIKIQGRCFFPTFFERRLRLGHKHSC